MIILGIESSCDETAAALVENGTTLHSQSLATSLSQHITTGGIVPEVAARAQIESIIPVLQATLGDGEMARVQDDKKFPQSRNLAISQSDIDAIAVTAGPGLVGSLLIGVETAKALALAWHKPLIPVNHMLGHIYGTWLTYGSDMEQQWPKLALLVSGGHTELILMESHQKLYKVGWTVDDAAGEAFDKAAKLLNLPYPGGPALSQLAQSGNAQAIPFPQPMPGQTNFNFSFSGLKTALYNHLKENPSVNPADVAASFQHTIVKSLVTKTRRAAEYYQAKEVILGGGVAANQLLRQELVTSLPLPVRVPDFEFTTDNAAVIASAAYFHNYQQPWSKVQADPSLELPLVNA